VLTNCVYTAIGDYLTYKKNKTLQEERIQIRKHLN